MKDIEYIKEFYNTQFRMDGMPYFEELDEVQLKNISNLTRYAFWKTGKHFQEIGDELKKWFNKLFA